MSRDKGIETRHGVKCPQRDDGSKRCTGKGCSHRAQVYDKRIGKSQKSPWTTRDEAKSWRLNLLNEIAAGVSANPSDLTLRAAWGKWKAAASAGTIRTRSGDAYKPSAIRGYDGTMKNYVLPDYGNHAAATVTREGLQRFVGEMVTAGRSPSTIRNTINGLRVLYRDVDQFVSGGLGDPTMGLRLPSVRQKRGTRLAVADVAKMLAALPEGDRPIWATFFYAGLRLGEARALRWQDVDFARGLLVVPHGWDQVEGRIATKSVSGDRKVPTPGALRTELVARQKVAANTSPDDLVFGRDDGRPVAITPIHTRAKKAWEAAGLPVVTPHGARHAYAALMLGAGVSLKALSEYMGHASITITSDNYAYLLEGTEAADAGKLDALLTAA